MFVCDPFSAAVVVSTEPTQLHRCKLQLGTATQPLHTLVNYAAGGNDYPTIPVTAATVATHLPAPAQKLTHQCAGSKSWHHHRQDGVSTCPRLCDRGNTDRGGWRDVSLLCIISHGQALPTRVCARVHLPALPSAENLHWLCYRLRSLLCAHH